MDVELIDFLTAIENSKTEEEVWNAWLQSCKKIGFEAINYVFAKSNDSGLIQTSHLTNLDDKWMEYYLSENYQNMDYLVQYMMSKTIIPITHDVDKLNHKYVDTKAKHDIYQYASEYGMSRALAIPFLELQGDGYGGVSIGSSMMSSEDFESIMNEKGTLLFSLAQVAHQHLKHRAINPDTFSSIKFSPRQEEIIKYLSNGLTNKEISYRLNISMPTVSFHLKAIAEKLNVKTNREILPKALALKLIEI